MYLRDTGYNLDALAASLTLETPETFADYVAWLHRLLTERGIGTRGLPLHFECIEDALRDVLPEEDWAQVHDYLQFGLREIGQAPTGRGR
jgi:hypothetical protein